MNNKGFIMWHGKHHCIMLTDNNCKTKEILKRFLTENPDFEKSKTTEILSEFDLYASDIKKLIDPCIIAKTENEYQVTISKKDRPHIVLKYPIEENGKLIFIEEI